MSPDQATVAVATRPDRSPTLALGHRFLDDLPELCVRWQAEHAPNPEPVILNESLANELGLDTKTLRGPAGTAVFSGATTPPGAEPVAMVYAGHQFGNYSPRLGDGRALLLGEVADPDGRSWDVHLKGSGRTPFARGGDGRATIGPMLREYLVSHALHALGVPTTRSLAVVTTGRTVLRDGPEPGAVLTRIAAGHVRVGTFEYAVRLGGTDLVRRLADHVIARHHPTALEADEPYRALLEAVIDVQADLVARWMLVGFIHGVMNTDNMTISGEGIDYGPCAFMDRSDPATVFSSIDHAGRYAYGNQPSIAAWNLARFAETVLGLISEDPAEAVEVATDLVRSFPDRFRERWQVGMAAKVGLDEPDERDADLFDDLTDAMRSDGSDWTGMFRVLADDLRARGRSDDAAPDPLDDTVGDGSASTPLEDWKRRWFTRLDRQRRPADEVADAMDRVNPVHIPRNHLVDEALTAAAAGDLEPFHTLMGVLAAPFTRRPGGDRFARPAPDGFTEGFRTFCGT